MKGWQKWALVMIWTSAVSAQIITPPVSIAPKPQESPRAMDSVKNNEPVSVATESTSSTVLGPDLSKVVQQNLEQLEKITPVEFPQKIDRIRDDIMKFIEHKSRVCNGDFSPTALEDLSPAGTKKVIRLTREERLLCVKELRAIQVHFINSAFEARKRYLSYLHEVRLRELDLARDDVLKGLNSTMSRIR